MRKYIQIETVFLVFALTTLLWVIVFSNMIGKLEEKHKHEIEYIQKNCK